MHPLFCIQNIIDNDLQLFRSANTQFQTPAFCFHKIEIKIGQESAGLKQAMTPAVVHFPVRTEEEGDSPFAFFKSRKFGEPDGRLRIQRLAGNAINIFRSGNSALGNLFSVRTEDRRGAVKRNPSVWSCREDSGGKQRESKESGELVSHDKYLSLFF